jgi:hypothetical protein|tara:strand:+ start:351 stop:968 length:618 start_codon:yes stop_codon:yes gene_type:complete
MKLASLEPLTPGFVRGLAETHGRGYNDAPEYIGRDRVKEGAPPGELEMDAEDDLADDSIEGDVEAVDDELEAEEEELPMEEPGLDAEGDEGRMISVDDFLGALETALEGVMGDEVEIDSDEMSDEAPEEEELEVDAELAPAGDEEMEIDAEEEEELMEGGDKKGDEPADDLDYEKNESTKDTDDLVEQLTKRVAARILKSALTKR